MNSTQNAETETEDKKSSDGNEGMDIDTVRRIEKSTITLNSTRQAEKEMESKTLSDRNEGMVVDDAKRVEPSKDKVTAEADIDVKAGDKTKRTRLELQPLKTDQKTKTEKICKNTF